MLMKRGPLYMGRSDIPPQEASNKKLNYVAVPNRSLILRMESMNHTSLRAQVWRIRQMLYIAIQVT